MSQINSIKLQTSCILNVPFEIYGNDFSFIVNGKEYKTNKIISDLISPYISKIHSTDPTFDKFHINTKQQGDFSNILQLINFEANRYPENELPFLLEVIEILNNDSIELETTKQKSELTIDNIFDNIQQHEKYSKFYRPLFEQEIEFISSHISSILESKEEELAKLSKDTLYSIFSNDQLQLKNEDELLKFINKLYTTDETYSILYETVLFENVSVESICEFVSIFDSEMMTCDTWKRLTVRLCKEINDDTTDDRKRYTEKKKILKGITFSKDNEYDGIINYLRKKSNRQIENEIKITASSLCISHYYP